MILIICTISMNSTIKSSSLLTWLSTSLIQYILIFFCTIKGILKFLPFRFILRRCRPFFNIFEIHSCLQWSILFDLSTSSYKDDLVFISSANTMTVHIQEFVVFQMQLSLFPKADKLQNILPFYSLKPSSTQEA